MKLNSAQRDTFYREGYLSAQQVLLPVDTAPLIDDFNELIDGIACRLYDKGAIRNRHEDEPFERRIACLTREAGKSLQSLVSFPVNLRPAMFAFLHTPRLLDAVESTSVPKCIATPRIMCVPSYTNP